MGATDSRKILGWMQSVHLGRKIQDEFPEIAGDYLNEMYLKEIVTKYDFPHRYRISIPVGKSAVHYALSGFEGGHFHGGNVDAYPGLITDRAVLTDLAHKLRSRGGANHSISKDMRMKQSLAGKNSALKRGLVPWPVEEAAEAYILSHSSLFRNGRGTMNEPIAQWLNDNYHRQKPIRNRNSVRAFLNGFRKKIIEHRL